MSEKGKEQLLDVKTSDLVFDEQLQMRADIPDIDEYVQVLKEHDQFFPFPPLVAYRIRGKLKVVDGFTRGRAALSAKVATVPVVVHDGTMADAMQFAFGCNEDHGYRRTNRDKQKATLKAIHLYADNKEISNNQIALICKVSRTYVRKLREELEGPKVPPPKAVEYQQHGECPNCKLDQWLEKANGIRCAGCDHKLGEKTAKQLADETRKAEKPKAASSQKPEAKAGQVLKKPSGAINRNKKVAAEASTSLGQLIRSLAELKELDGLKQQVEAIQKVVNRRKREG